MLGGAAVHFALAASFFDEVRVVGPVGDDFGEAEYAVLHDARRRSPTTSSTSPGGKTFFWNGEYERDLNIRDTLDTQLNVFEHFEPKLSEASRDCRRPLPGQHPARPPARGARAVPARPLRRAGLDGPVDRHRARLAVRTIATVDCLILNDGEIQQLTDEPNLVRAARAVLELGPERRRRQAGRVRRGAVHRATASSRCPPTRLDDVVDPTGAGDTFAGGFVGYVAAHADEELDRRAAAPRDGLRHRAGVVQRRGVRHRARADADRRRDHRARRRAPADHALRRRAVELRG